jgi:hypothetical protein
MSNDKPATSKEIRDWANANGITVGLRGPVHLDVISAYKRAHKPAPADLPVTDE